MRLRYSKLCQELKTEFPQAQLIAVSKGHPIEAIETLAGVGQQAFGENYADELIKKATALAHLPLEWHFLGHLQRNKVKKLLPYLACLHSLDGSRLALALALELKEASLPLKKILPVFLQVNLSGESTKSGISAEGLPELAQLVASLPQLKLMGLMTLPDPKVPPQQTFRALQAHLQNLSIPHANALSMGMSQDFKIALQCGATHIRVGSVLFGPRAQKASPTASGNP